MHTRQGITESIYQKCQAELYTLSVCKCTQTFTHIVPTRNVVNLMLHVRDINLRNDPDSSAPGILHNLPSIFLSVVSFTFIIAGCELGKARKWSVQGGSPLGSTPHNTKSRYTQYTSGTSTGRSQSIWNNRHFRRWIQLCSTLTKDRTQFTLNWCAYFSWTLCEGSCYN